MAVALRLYDASALEADQLKRFLLIMISLEALIHAYLKSGSVNGKVTWGPVLLKARDYPQIRTRFAYMSTQLFPEEAPAHMVSFAKLINARNALVHGRHNPADRLPTFEAQKLRDRYFKAVFIGLG